MYDFCNIGPRNSQWQTKGFEEAERIIWWDGSVGLFVKPWETYVSTLSSQPSSFIHEKMKVAMHAGCGAFGRYSLPNLFCCVLESFDSYFDIWKISIYIRMAS